MFGKLLTIMDNGGAADILTIIDGPAAGNSGRMAIVHGDGRIESQCDETVVRAMQDYIRTAAWVKPATFAVDAPGGGQYRIFWDKVVNEPRAIVFGGGHISLPLVQILSLLDFAVTVVDDRPEFANKTRFPNAQNVICENFRRVLSKLAIDGNTAVIIVTRGHKYDMDCLRATMDSSARYLGMIGSRKRVREILGILREEGAPEELPQRLKSPIGLDIKAETPAEIAVSIAAEVVAVFRGAGGVNGSPVDRAVLESICTVQNKGERAALATVVETRGSTPRKAGSRMIVLPGGASCGTIGGGCGEAEVRRQALMALDENRSGLFALTMTNSVAADEGMVCGGVMEVFIQIV